MSPRAPSVVPCRGGEELLRALFEPLGYAVEAKRLELDPKFPEWGPSSYFSVKLKGTVRLQELLSHLYVLLPVLDDSKHYYVAEDEISKLVAKGEGWLAQHPRREQIARRYFKHKGSYVRQALAQLVADEQCDIDAAEQAKEREETDLEKRLSLNDQRMTAVVNALRAADVRTVLDLGCGEGKLLHALLGEKYVQRMVGVDVSYRALEIAHRKLHLEEMAARKRERIELIQGSLTYRDARLSGFDAACLVEVIEHVDPSRLGALERTVFEFARPRMVIITTPNVEYNARFANLAAGRLRHRDHRFEWTRVEFEAWARGAAERHGYIARIASIGTEDEEVGASTQMGVFTR